MTKLPEFKESQDFAHTVNSTIEAADKKLEGFLLRLKLKNATPPAPCKPTLLKLVK